MHLKVLNLLALIFLFKPICSSEPSLNFNVERIFTEIKLQRETGFKSCCKINGIPNTCSHLCTYDYKSFSDNPVELLKSLNPGWFLVHYFLPGKCYLSELHHLLPCAIESQNLTSCCQDITKVEEMMQTFPQLKEYQQFLPATADIEKDPKWCQEICSGKPFKITPKTLLSCSSTFKASLTCYWHGKANAVILQQTGLSAENVKSVQQYVNVHGIPDTLEKAKAMLQNIDPKVIQILVQKTHLLESSLEKAGASQEQIKSAKLLLKQLTE